MDGSHQTGRSTLRIPLRSLSERIADHRRQRFLGAAADREVFRCQVMPDPLRGAVQHIENDSGRFVAHASPMEKGQDVCKQA